MPWALAHSRTSLVFEDEEEDDEDEPHPAGHPVPGTVRGRGRGRGVIEGNHAWDPLMGGWFR